MNETRRKPTTGRQSPSLCDKWHGIFYMPSRIDEAGHTKAFDYPVAEHWGESRNVQFRRWDSNRQHISPESNVLPTDPAWLAGSLTPIRTHRNHFLNFFGERIEIRGQEVILPYLNAEQNVAQVSTFLNIFIS